MSQLVVEAIYENGVLRPAHPLPFREREHVRISVEPHASWAERTAGIVKWTGDLETLERLAIDPEFDPQEGG